MFDFCYCIAVLAVEPGDEDALRCKIVALIKADDIDRALSTIQASENRPFDFSLHKVLLSSIDLLCVELSVKFAKF